MCHLKSKELPLLCRQHALVPDENQVERVQRLNNPRNEQHKAKMRFRLRALHPAQARLDPTSVLIRAKQVEKHLVL